MGFENWVGALVESEGCRSRLRREHDSPDQTHIEHSRWSSRPVPNIASLDGSAEQHDPLPELRGSDLQADEVKAGTDPPTAQIAAVPVELAWAGWVRTVG